MNTNMYKIFFEIQKKHWWFVTKKSIVLDFISRLSNRPRNSKILDIGCGSGLMLSSLQSFGKVSGMDMSDDAIKFSKEIFKGVVKKGDLPGNIPYKKSSFDIITALDVIEHVDDDLQALHEIYALLRNKGSLIITVPAYMFLWTSFDEVNQHKRRYTLSDLDLKLKKSGFIVEKISYYNSILFPVVFLVRMINKMLGVDGMSDVEMPGKPVNFLLAKIFGIERILLKYLNLPFGVSIIAVARSS